MRYSNWTATIVICILQIHHAFSEHPVMAGNAESMTETTPPVTTSSSTEPVVENLQARGEVYRHNRTKQEIIDLVEFHGYVAKEGSGGQIFILRGDILVYPEELIPELQEWGAGRRNLLKNNLWLDEKGEAVVKYFYDTNSKADETVFAEAVKMWQDNTCINFIKIEPTTCEKDLGFAAVCVGNFGGCHSLLGRHYGPGQVNKRSQQMSVQPQGCEDIAAAHEFGHALGLNHEMARADRDQHIKTHFENIDIPIESIKDENSIISSWFQGGKCSADQLFDADKPYDPMSIMQYAASDFAEQDARIVYASLNAKHQYMFDYHRPAGFPPTHYDNYIVNMGYRCVERWRKACIKGGKTPPKCKNTGYTKKDCTCACPVGFAGNACEKKTGPMFPIQERAKAQLEITKPGLVDLAGKGLKMGGKYRKERFAMNYYIALYIRSKKDTRISVRVLQDFSKISTLYGRDDVQDSFMADIEKKDCIFGLRMYVGDMKTGNARTECFSRIFGNDSASDAPVYTSKNSSLDFIGFGMSALTVFSNRPESGLHAMELKFNVSFLEMPERVLTNDKKPTGTVGALLKGLGLGSGSKGSASSIILFIIIGIIGIILVLVVIGAVIFYLVKRKKRSQQTAGSHHRGSGSESGSVSDTDSESG